MSDKEQIEVLVKVIKDLQEKLEISKSKEVKKMYFRGIDIEDMDKKQFLQFIQHVRNMSDQEYFNFTVNIS